MPRGHPEAYCGSQRCSDGRSRYRHRRSVESEHKFFLTASPKERARRRQERTRRGRAVDFDTVLEEVLSRDRIDSDAPQHR